MVSIAGKQQYYKQGGYLLYREIILIYYTMETATVPDEYLYSRLLLLALVCGPPSRAGWERRLPTCLRL